MIVPDLLDQVSNDLVDRLADLLCSVSDLSLGALGNFDRDAQKPTSQQI